MDRLGSIRLADVRNRLDPDVLATGHQPAKSRVAGLSAGHAVAVPGDRRRDRT